MTSNVMIIGASGRLGLALIHALSSHSSNPNIHAFLRTPSKLPESETALCTTVQKGDAIDPADVQKALEATNATTVIVAIGVPNNLEKTNLREQSAKALMSVIKPSSKYDHVRVVCVSSVGAGGSKIIIGMGIGSLITRRLRFVLKDHDVQEETFLTGVASSNADRLLIVRPTNLTDGKATGKVITFTGTERTPSGSIDRKDVAEYITNQVCSSKKFGMAVNITTGK